MRIRKAVGRYADTQGEMKMKKKFIIMFIALFAAATIPLAVSAQNRYCDQGEYRGNSRNRVDGPRGNVRNYDPAYRGNSRNLKSKYRGDSRNVGAYNNGTYYEDGYYNDGYVVRQPNVYDRHRKAINLAIGAGAGAAVGSVIGGKKGALIGAAAGIIGGAIVTKKQQPRNYPRY